MILLKSNLILFLCCGFSFGDVCALAFTYKSNNSNAYLVNKGDFESPIRSYLRERKKKPKKPKKPKPTTNPNTSSSGASPNSSSSGEIQNYNPGSTNSNNNSAEDMQSLPSCGDNKSLFTVSPIIFSDIYGILPLGNLAPPSHTFPTRHLYFHIRRTPPNDPTALTVKTFLYSPGDIFITKIGFTENLTTGFSDYIIQFSPCKEVNGYFLHVSSISEKLKEQFSTSSNDCTTQELGNRLSRTCSKEVLINVKAGEIIGTVGGEGENALDFEATDRRVTPLEFANPSRWKLKDYTVCPIDYFTPELKAELESKLGDGITIRKVSPVCGQIAQDVPNTLQGIWYVQGTTNTAPEDPHLALVHDNVAPTKGVFSIGTSLKELGLEPGLYYFIPKEEGLINRDFKEITSNNQVYCFQTFSRFEDLNTFNTAILVQLFSPTTLHIGKHSGTGCGMGPWELTKFIEFER